jgi:hypothetical protein
MRPRLYFLSIVAALVGCAEVAETPATHAVGADRPAWFRAAVAESAHSLQYVGCDKAPLELINTDDPLWEACLVETATAAESARQRIYMDALNECVEWRGVDPQCCFARITDSASEASRQEMCEAECRKRRGVAGRRYRAAPKCQSEMVVYTVDIRRFRTTMVDSVLARCAVGDSDASACEKLPTKVERRYCAGACAVERADFVNSLRECTSRVSAGSSVSCEHLFRDKPIASPATEAERKAECERRCSPASMPPLQ